MANHCTARRAAPPGRQLGFDNRCGASGATGCRQVCRTAHQTSAAHTCSAHVLCHSCAWLVCRQSAENAAKVGWLSCENERRKPACTPVPALSRARSPTCAAVAWKRVCRSLSRSCRSAAFRFRHCTVISDWPGTPAAAGPVLHRPRWRAGGGERRGSGLAREPAAASLCDTTRNSQRHRPCKATGGNPGSSSAKLRRLLAFQAPLQLEQRCGCIASAEPGRRRQGPAAARRSPGPQRQA